MHITSVIFGYIAAGFGVIAILGEFGWRHWVNRWYEGGLAGLTAAQKVNRATDRNKRLSKGIEIAFAATALSVFLSLGATFMSDKENTNLSQRITALETNLNKITSRVTELENKPPPPGLGTAEAGDIKKLKADVTELTRTVDALVGNVTAISRQFANIHSQLDKIDRQIRSLDTQIKLLGQRPQPG